MIYDLSKTVDQNKFKLRCRKLYEDQKVVELKTKSNKRTLPQNSYLHLLLAYFASQTGYSTSYVKLELFKKVVNREVFRVVVMGSMGEVEDWKSSASLDKDQMRISIDRFKRWSIQEAGILLPDAEDREFIVECEKEIENVKPWI